jgi:hypothetical protein
MGTPERAPAPTEEEQTTSSDAVPSSEDGMGGGHAVPADHPERRAVGSDEESLKGEDY